MAISFVGVGEFDVSAGTPSSAQANMPAGIAVNDVMILAVTENKVPVVFTPPGDGWTAIETSQIEETALTGIYYWKKATVAGGGTAPTISSDTGGGWRLDVAVYRGVDTTNPFIDHGGAIESGGAGTTTHSTPTLSNTDAGAWGVVSMAFRQVATPTSWTPGTGLTERVDADIGASNTTNIAQAWADTNGTITTGSKSWDGTSSSGSAQAIMWAAILRPGSAALSGSLDRTGAGTAVFTALAVAASGTMARTGSGTTVFTPSFVTAAGSLARTGSGTTSFGGTPRPAATLAQTGSGSLSLDGQPAWTASLARTGSGTTTFVGVGTAFLDLTGSGTLAFTPLAMAILAGLLARTGSGTTVFAPTLLTISGSMARTGSGTASFTGTNTGTGSLAVTGVGVLNLLTATYLQVWTGSTWQPRHAEVWTGTAWTQSVPVTVVESPGRLGR